MTDREWAEEVDRAIAGAGLPCRRQASWIERRGPMCCAELIDTRSGKDRTIGLSREEFATVAARRVEIVRQLQDGQ